MDIFELKDHVANNDGPVDCWCVTDYDDFWIQVFKGQVYPNGEMTGENYVLPLHGFEQNYRYWELYNEVQLSECPWLV